MGEKSGGEQMRGLQGPRGTVVIKGGLGGDGVILCPYCGDRTVT